MDDQSLVVLYHFILVLAMLSVIALIAQMTHKVLVLLHIILHYNEVSMF